MSSTAFTLFLPRQRQKLQTGKLHFLEEEKEIIFIIKSPVS